MECFLDSISQSKLFKQQLYCKQSMEEVSETKPTSPSNLINIKVKNLNNELFEFTVPNDIKISDFKRQIEQTMKIPQHRQRLIFKGKLLQDPEPLCAYKVEQGHVVQVVASTHQPSISSSRSQSSHINHSQAARIEQFRRRNNFYQRHRYLQRRMNGFRINQPESLEVLEQNKYTIDQLVNSIDQSAEEFSPEPFCFKNRRFSVGTWVDVRDAMGQWYEGQVLGCHNNYVLVHYNGWSDMWNQWIEISSNRLLPFRSNTVQSTHSLYMSPFPLNPPPLAKTSNPSFQKSLPEFLYSLQKTLGKISSLLRQSQKSNPDSQFDDANTYRQEADLPIPQNKLPEAQKVNFELRIMNEQNKLEGQFDAIDMKQEQPQIQTPTKELHHNVSVNDNLSNKCDDNVSNKCENDDMSNKSYKSKRSEGLVDTSSMKSLKIEDKPSIFYDLQAKSVRSMKSQIHKTGHHTYLIHPPFQGGILEEEDSQQQEQESCYQLERRASMKKHIKQEKIRKENERIMKTSQLAPLLDRMGRLMIDLAPHVALLGNTDQLSSHQNLSVATNEGSLQSRIVNYLRNQAPQPQSPEPHSPPYNQQYCDFQIPIMLTPIEIYALNEIQAQTYNFDG